MLSKVFAIALVSCCLGGSSLTIADDVGIGPSFDCSALTAPDETLICADNQLKRYDWWLDQIYGDALTLSQQKADLIEEQRRWLKGRRACVPHEAMSPDDDLYHCLSKAYHSRIEQLRSVSVDLIWESAVVDIKQAQEKLQRLESPLAVLYADVLERVQTIESIKSFDDFADDLAQRIGYAKEWRHGPIRIQIPCALVAQYPRLLMIAAPRFGSSLDLALPTIKCAADTASYPGLVRDYLLSERTWQSQVQCTYAGTISYAYGRDLWLHELRMAQFPTSYLSSDLYGTSDGDTPWPSTAVIEGSAIWIHPDKFLQARDALAAYYRANFQLDPDSAVEASTRALWDNRWEGEEGDPPPC